jgi:hypothetical protein
MAAKSHESSTQGRMSRWWKHLKKALNQGYDDEMTYISSDGGPDGGLVAPARTPSRGSANEADDGEEGLNGLHFDAERLYSTVTRVV